MDPDQDVQRQRRATVMAVAVAGILGGSCLLFAVAATSGLALIIPLALAVLAGIAFVHYLLWGRSMSRDTAGERAEEARRRAIDIEEWDVPRMRPPRSL
jgi:threonine/homoserine efflux transporter RhtA